MSGHDGDKIELLLHPDELRGVIYEHVGVILSRPDANDDTGRESLSADAIKMIDEVVAAGTESLVKAAVFNALKQKLCRADELVAVTEPRNSPDGLVQALHLRRSQKAAVDALEEILKSGPGTSPGGRGLPVEAYECKGRRPTMEDTVVMVQNVALDVLGDTNRESDVTSMFAVFDGHAGCEASAYCKRNLPFEIARSSKFGADLKGALIEGLERCDALFCEKCKREDISSGTTACVTLIRDSTLHIAWLGDSQAVLVRNDNAIHLNEPHKPDREDEKKRIEDSGGVVVWYGTWRVNGKLAVSRAIGDVDSKEQVIGTPSYDSLTLDGRESILVVACDGLWDVMTPDECALFAKEHFEHNNGKSTGLAEALCNRAYHLNSSDNISAVVVDLRERHA